MTGEPMPNANEADTRILRAMERWQDTADEELMDIAGWRGHEAARADFLGDSQRYWHPEPPSFFADTNAVVAWVRNRHSGVDTSPIEDIYQAVRTWHADHTDLQIVNQRVLEGWRDRATTILVTAHQAILARQGQGILASPVEEPPLPTADLESELEQAAPIEVARKWLELAGQYPFWDYRQASARLEGDPPLAAPRWMTHFGTQREAMAWFRPAAKVLARHAYKAKPDHAAVLLRISRDRTNDASLSGDVASAMPLVDELMLYLEAASGGNSNQVTVTHPVQRAKAVGTNGVRRGRLSKADREAKRTSMLATIRQHPSLSDDPAKLANMIGVSESTARRWLDEERQQYQKSRSARPDDDED
jgi:hypothetical protein